MIITVTNQKGGTGKTTTSVNLAGYLGKMGKRVLLVDLDPQGNATSGMGMTGVTVGMYDFMMNDEYFQTTILRSDYRNVDIVPGTQDTAGISVEIVNHPKREFILSQKISVIAPQYDFVIIDSPPSLGLITLNGLVAADKVIIPVQCEYYALEGLGQLLETIQLVSKSVKPNLRVLGALLTMHDKRNRLSHMVIKEVRRYFPGYVFEAVIPRNVALSEAPSYGKPIHAYNNLSKGAFAYRKLAEEVISLADQDVA
jgi:chromosome partitioning protein